MSRFEKNTKGGWIVPDNEIIPKKTVIPPFSEIGNMVQFREYCSVGDNSSIGALPVFNTRFIIGNFCRVGDYAKFGEDGRVLNNCLIGSNARFQSEVHFGEMNIIGPRARLGSNCHVGEGTTFQGDLKTGKLCSFMERVSLGDNAEIGPYAMFSDECSSGHSSIIGYSAYFGNYFNFGSNTVVGSPSAHRGLNWTFIDFFHLAAIGKLGSATVFLSDKYDLGVDIPTEGVGQLEQILAKAETEDTRVSVAIIRAAAYAMAESNGRRLGYEISSDKK